jgi:D-alanyl-lipoteichoic acid acyltransferase DltB (MBOAT superfamily)
LRAALGLVGVHLPDVALEIVLPVGISFYTFQSMSYVIDVYRRQIEPETSFLRFATAIALFVHLVAGPIVRARKLLPQMRSDRPFHLVEFCGLRTGAVGLLQKVAIADSAAPSWTNISEPSIQPGMTLVLALLFYSIQIYCDFSGYTDIALGCAHMLGYDLGMNFNRPYFSRGFSEFWTRWHISLSEWLRVYLYISLGGNRLGDLRSYANLMLTMLIGGCGLAPAGFVVWGGLHGLYLIVERIARPWLHRAAVALRVPRVITTIVAIAGVFVAVSFAWIFFRSQTFTAATEMIVGIATRTQFSLAEVQQKFSAIKALGLIALLLLVEALSFHPTLFDRLRRYPTIRYASAALTLLGIALFGTFSGAAFIYFQF